MSNRRHDDHEAFQWLRVTVGACSLATVAGMLFISPWLVAVFIALLALLFWLDKGLNQ